MDLGRTILIVEDDAAIGRALEFMLKRGGYRVRRASDGEIALAMFHEAPPDAVITDLHIGKVDGRTFCEQTDAVKATHPFLTIVCSGSVSWSEQHWMRDLHDTVFIEKPFRIADIMSRLDAYFVARGGGGLPPDGAGSPPAREADV